MIDEDIPDVTSNSYHLFSVLYGHAGDVRDVMGLMNDLFASCSRDGTIKIWQRTEFSYEVRKSLTGHTNINKMGTNALYYIKPGIHPVFKEGCLLSSAYDKSICVWDIPAITKEEANPILTLWGHSEAPTSLSVSVDGNILSGGSDNIGRIWRGNRTIQELRGHVYPIWSIIGLANGDIVTGSGDRNIKIWKGNQCIKTISHHKDAVRCLADVPGVGFLSCSNDGVINLWTYDGTLLQSLVGHEGFVYKVAVISPSEFVSASEDTTVKIWKGGECIQTLEHPAGLWSVSILENGDIVSAGQDGGLRVWSKDPTRIATADVMDIHTQEIVEKHRQKDLSALNIDQLPGPEALLVPGTKENQRLYIKRDGKPFLYTWNAENNNWTCVGEIVSAKGDNANQGLANKKYIDGVEYDFIFDVELGDAKKQLTFNLGEDPYVAAQYFIQENQLDQNYLDEVAKFIIRNVPNWKDAPPKAFSRGKQNKSSTETKIPTSKYKNFPQFKPVLFEGGNLPQVLGKIKSFNEALAASEQTAALSLNDQNWQKLEQAFAKVSQTSRYHATSFSSKEYEVIDLVLNWPSDKIFPVLDFIRLMALHPEAANHWISTNFVSKVLTTGLKKDGHNANAMLTFRFVANLFMLPTVRSKLVTFQETLLENITDTFSTSNKNTRIALATVLLNFSVLYLQHANEQGTTQTLSVLAEALKAPDSDEEVQFRLLVSLGTLIYSNKDNQSLCRDLDIPDSLNSLINSPSDRIKNCILELQSSLKE